MKKQRLIEQIISFPFYILSLGFLHINVKVQHDMTKLLSGVSFFKKATYKEVKEKMLSVEWEIDRLYEDSLFDYKGGNHYHAGIIKFYGVGYLLSGYGLFMANRLQRKIYKKIDSKSFID